ncbi:DEAD/DEAH box helicase [Scatolibacter rhodanostii]|uniref:DEAD/DEAH box helicase n=1 Tax=Scatolibacter rhodanostii TaxID=2014781 RepID=UPI000C0855E0|nr:DEAD/DEAH box helicase [Scatolibacter rhodanostii]
MDFNQYDLSAEMLRSLEKMKFAEPTPVQAETILPMLEKHDLLVQSPTGSGKTAAFGIPVIEAINPKNRNVQAVILCPTRELALQTTTVLHNLSTYKHNVRIITLYGGEQIGKQISALRKQPQIIVATPGRLIDHIQRRTVKLDQTEVVVLDEADRMLDMGFRDDMKAILDQVPSQRQTVLFSATLSTEICQIAESYQTEAQVIKIKPDFRKVDLIKQFYTEVPIGGKVPVLETFLKEQSENQVLVFVGTKSMADKLSETLVDSGLHAEALHGGLKQTQRDRVMRRFRQGMTRVLIATDVAARGIDVNDMGAVINFDIPATSDDYVHRIGRTGRANHSGTAYTLLYIKERRQLQMIMRETKAIINQRHVEGVVATAPAAAHKRPAARRNNTNGAKPFAARNKTGKQSRPAGQEKSASAAKTDKPAKRKNYGEKKKTPYWKNRKRQHEVA